jgi:hypothetical protein
VIALNSPARFARFFGPLRSAVVGGVSPVPAFWEHPAHPIRLATAKRVTANKPLCVVLMHASKSSYEH